MRRHQARDRSLSLSKRHMPWKLRGDRRREDSIHRVASRLVLWTTLIGHRRTARDQKNTAALWLTVYAVGRDLAFAIRVVAVLICEVPLTSVPRPHPGGSDDQARPHHKDQNRPRSRGQKIGKASPISQSSGLDPAHDRGRDITYWAFIHRPCGTWKPHAKLYAKGRDSAPSRRKKK